jgi:hypothetical protein
VFVVAGPHLKPEGRMMNRHALLTVLVVMADLIAPATAHATLFSGNAVYTTAPWTQAPGPVVNTLSLANTPTGFSLTGQYQVTLPGGNYSGILLAWEVERPLDPTFTPAQWMTNTSSLVGFISAPVGNIAAAGALLTEYTATAGSTAVAPFNYVGPGITNFNINQSATFFYNPGGTNFLRQSYFADFNYNGPGGAYIVDFPADSISQPLPEPASLALLALPALGLLRPHRRPRA